MIKPKRIFVVGQMGAGKAILSEALAKKLGWQFNKTFNQDIIK